MTYQTGVLTGSIREIVGAGVGGTATIIPIDGAGDQVPAIINTTGDTVLASATTVTLGRGGSLQVRLPATDDVTLVPSGFGYRITVAVDDGTELVAEFALPGGTTVDLSDVYDPIAPPAFEPTVPYATATQLASEAAARAAADVPGLLVGTPVSDNCCGIADGTARVTSATHRSPHTIQVACTDLRFAWHSWLNNGTANAPNFADADSAAAAVIRASVEIAGTIYRLTFNGRTDATIDGGGMVQSDPLPLEVAAGTVIYVRTFVVSGTWHYTHYSFVAGGAGGNSGASSDLTAPGSGAIADSTFSAQFAPSAITGTPLDAATAAAVLGVGDSVTAGYGDGPGTNAYQGRNVTNPQLHGGGFILRALHGKCGSIVVAQAGDSGSGFVTNIGHFRRMSFARNCTTMVCGYGRNDVTGGNSLATIQATLIAIWRLGSRRGLRVIQTTITPRTNSTDGWRTVGNQTTVNAGQETVRVNLNNWLRDGAPVASAGNLTAVATGTVGALRASQTGHPLYGVWDVTDVVESARDSGLWKAWVNARTVNDAAINSGGNSLNSATATFTDADLGRMVYVAGAGAGSAALYSMIQSRTSATQCQPNLNAGTTVNGATATIADGFTLDGVHPGPYAAALMAAACDTTMVS